MLLQLSIVPLGRGRSISPDLADVVKIIQASGLDYRVTATATILEGDWDQLMDECDQAVPPEDAGKDRARSDLHENR